MYFVLYILLDTDQSGTSQLSSVLKKSEALPSVLLEDFSYLGSLSILNA